MGFEADSAVLTSVGLNEKGGLDVRLYETRGRESAVTVTVPFEVKSAALVDLD